MLGAGPHLLKALCAYQQWWEVRVPTACFLCPKPPPRVVSTALHRDEGVAHVSDGHRRAMLPNVGAMPATASSSVGRLARFHTALLVAMLRFGESWTGDLEIRVGR